MADNEKKRSPNFTEEEKIILLQFVQQYKKKLLGKAGRPGHGDDKVEERKAKYWHMCAATVSRHSGIERDWKQVRKAWSSLKDKAKNVKRDMERTGGGSKPKTTPSLELAMEVVAPEVLEGLRGRQSEVDPLGQAVPAMSQDSSQESIDVGATASSTTAPTSAATTSALATFASATTSTSNQPFIALQQQVSQLQTKLETLSAQPSSLQHATEIRQLKFQEELLKLEKTKVDIQLQALEIQKKKLTAMESLGARALFNSVSEQ